MKNIKGLLYCTKEKKQKDLLWSNNLKHFFLDGAYNRLIDNLPKYLLNGKIVAECDFDVEKHNETTNDWLCMSLREKIVFGNLCEKASIDELECYDYANGKPLYALHISNLKIFDEPKELSNYHISYFNKEFNMMREKHIEKAPQNMCRAFDIKDTYILISIQPQELCRILNGEQTILIKKKVLKEMLENASK